MNANSRLHQEEDQHDQHQRHPEHHVVLDRVDCEPHQVAAVVERVYLDVRRQDAMVQLLGFLLNPGEHILRLLAAQHEDHAFDRVAIFLEAEFSQAWRVSDRHLADVADAHGNAVVVSDDDISNVFRLGYEAQAAHVEKLRALRVKPPARICIIGRQRRQNLGHGDVIAVNLRRIEQHLILHHGAAKPGIVGHSWYGFVGPFDDPVLNRFQFLGAAIRAFEHVTVNQAGRTEQRRQAGHHARGQLHVGQPLKHNLAGEVVIGAFLERHDDVGKPVK